MTTIGYATLQIIPSLNGVTDAIDKQIEGKVVSVSITPKVDQRAAETVGKQTREAVEKQTTQVKVEPKVDTRAAERAGKATGDAVAKGAKEAVSKADIGREAAKVIVEGIAGGMKEELRGGPLADEMVDGVVNGIKWGIDNARVSVGKSIIGSISDSIKAGNIGEKIKSAVLPTMADIGAAVRSSAAGWSSGIANALRAGDIQGATDDLGNRVRTTTDAIASIGSTFGLQLDGVREFGEGSATTLQTVGTNIQSILGTAVTVKSTLTDTGDLLGSVLPGRAGSGAKSIINSLGTILPVAGAVYEGLNRITQEWHAGQQERYWARWEESRRSEDMGLKPPQPGVGDFNGPPRVGQGNAPAAPKTVPLPDQIRAKVQAGQLPGYSLTPDGHILGPDGKPLPGLSIGGYTGNVPMKQIAGVVHGDEFVVQATSRQRIESDHPGLLDRVNATGKLPGYAGGGLVTGTAELRKIIGERFGISNIGGWRPQDKYGEHSTGRALDVMTSDKAKGDSVADFALANAPAIDLKWVIWQQRINSGNGWSKMEDRGNPTQNHMDHVHIFSGPGIANGLLGALKSKGAETGQGVAAGVNPPVGDTTVSSGGAEAVSAAAGGGSSSTGGGGFSLPSSISGLSGIGLSGMGVKTKATPNSPERTFEFGNAAAAAVGGQVSSALGVLGVGDSPGWLKGISQFVSGISVGGGSGGGPGAAPEGAGIGRFGGAAPIATSAAVPAPAALPAGTAHGAQAGAQPGPVFNTTISAFDTNDAVSMMRRQQDEVSAAKLSRWS